ncbi:MAG: ParA family protein, partial [Coleofasciculus sp. S288]|nr:ParA family protein [Coleofasciculus sp. S288]
VLVIDLDDQANSSLYLGVNRADELDQANSVDEFDQILESFQERKEVIDFLGLDFNSPNINYKDYIKPSTFNQYIYGNGRIDVLPGSYRTRDEGLTSTLGIREKLLNKALQRSGMAGDYDYVIIDTPPSSTLVAKNGLFAAQYVVIPTQMEYFSVYGIRTVTRKIQNEVQEEMNGERGRILGIVPMMTGGTKLNNLATQLIQRTLPNVKIFTEITRTVKWAEACQKYMPISVFAERDAAAGAAATKSSTLAQELIAQIDQEESQRGV